MGLICTIVTSGAAAPGCARLPGCTVSAPVMPLIGALMLVREIRTLVADTSACAAFNCACSDSSLLALVSTALVE